MPVVAEREQSEREPGRVTCAPGRDAAWIAERRLMATLIQIKARHAGPAAIVAPATRQSDPL
jgi:hypothetical protein